MTMKDRGVFHAFSPLSTSSLREALGIVEPDLAPQSRPVSMRVAVLLRSCLLCSPLPCFLPPAPPTPTSCSSGALGTHAYSCLFLPGTLFTRLRAVLP